MRRSSGEGSPRKRTDGRWEWSVMLNGKRHYVYGKTKAEAKAKYETLKGQHQHGLDVGASKQTLETFLLQWLTDVAKPKLRVRTAQQYERLVHTYILPARVPGVLGDIPLKDVGHQHIQRMINGLPAHLKPNTVRNIRAVLRRALNVALTWRLVSYNAAQGIEMPKIERYIPHTVTQEEARALREVIRGHPREALYLTAMCLGLRRGELLGLLKSDVNMQAKTLTVTGQVQTIQGKSQRGPLKTEASRRTLPIPDMLIPIIARALEQQPECTLLFPSDTGTAILPRNLIVQFKALLRKAGLPSTIRLHDLRHYAASVLLSNGADIVTTQAVLGHTDASTTLKYYAHAMPDTVRNVVNDVVNRTLAAQDASAPAQQDNL